MTDELLKEEKPNKVTIGGKEYQLSPLNMNVMMAIEEEFDCSFSDFGKVWGNKKTKEMTSIGKLLIILLKENHPDVTLPEIGKEINLDNMEAVATAIGTTLYGDAYKSEKTK